MSDLQTTDQPAAVQQLIDEARRARDRAHAPYSGFAVGAAARAADGRVFPGCNVEISSYGLTICAERVALFAARAAGAREIEALAVVGPGNGDVPTSPCGACRQVIWDLAGNIDVYLVTPGGNLRVRRTAGLLPDPFGPDQLEAGRDDDPRRSDAARGNRAGNGSDTASNAADPE